MDSEGCETVRLSFDSQVYELGVLQKAAIKFTEFCSFDFRCEANGTIGVTIEFPFSVVPNPRELAGQYRNEVLDQALRLRISNETETEKNLILAYAFSNTKLVSG